MVVPVDCHWRHAPARREFVLDRQLIGEGEGRQRVLLDAFDADERFGTQLQGPIRRAKNVHAPIADQTAAEIIKAAPVKRQVESETLCPWEFAAGAAPGACSAAAAAARPAWATRVARRDEIFVLLVARCERARRRAAEPQIPIERVWRGSRRRNLHHLLWPTGAPRPGVDFAHFADLARPEDFAGDARRVVRITLIAHLRGDLILCGRLCQQPRFPRCASQRFFY